MLGVRRYKKTQIDLWQGDITTFAVDAVVNAANESLSGGLGVDGAIHRVGGPSILKECKRLGGCPTGSSVITKAGHLPASWVIHTVGPKWGGDTGEATRLLKEAYLSVFQAAESLRTRHISIPAISTGHYGFPKDIASEIAFSALKDYLDTRSGTLPARVTFVAFDGSMYDTLQEQLFSRFADELDDQGF